MSDGTAAKSRSIWKPILHKGEVSAVADFTTRISEATDSERVSLFPTPFEESEVKAMLIKPELKRYLWRGLDLEIFDLIDILPQNRRFAAIILRNKRPDAYMPWCVEFRGGGHYFFTKAELYEYCRNRKWL
jgi:hypothetical protein